MPIQLLSSVLALMVSEYALDKALTWPAGKESRVQMSVPAAITEAVKVHRPKMVFLTSPNNPDGSVIAEEDLLAMLKLPVLVVLDEAYIEFSEEPSRLRWVLDHPNLVIFRTFSKSAGLAGLRVGYGESLDPASILL